MKEHTVTINGVETTMLLNDEDAKRLDATPASKGSGKADTSATTKKTNVENKSGTE